MAHVSLPSWVVPPLERVSRVRTAAAAAARASLVEEPDSLSDDLRIMLALDWVAGAAEVTPLTVMVPPWSSRKGG